MYNDHYIYNTNNVKLQQLAVSIYVYKAVLGVQFSLIKSAPQIVVIHLGMIQKLSLRIWQHIKSTNTISDSANNEIIFVFFKENDSQLIVFVR